jgi:hypothetical protein
LLILEGKASDDDVVIVDVSDGEFTVGVREALVAD